MENETNNPKRVVLACGGKKCCPVVELDEAAGEVVMTDDFGGKIRIPAGQAGDLRRALALLVPEPA